MAMKYLFAANQKGGVGKTSTLVHLAFDFSEQRQTGCCNRYGYPGQRLFYLKQFSSGIKSE